MRHGYARLSLDSPSLDAQVSDLNALACERIFQEQAGTERPRLAEMLAALQSGDEVLVTRLDRLARSTPDFFRILERLEQAGATVRCLEQPFETVTPAGRDLVTMLKALSELEYESRRALKTAGIEAAKGRGAYRVHKTPKKYDHAEMKRLYHHNMPVVQIAKKLGCVPKTVYEALKLNRKGHKANPLGRADEGGVT